MAARNTFRTMLIVKWFRSVVMTRARGGTRLSSAVLHGDFAAPIFPPQRIVSLNLAADEILLALTPPARIAALTYLADDPTYSNVRAEARAMTHKVKANAEQVLALQPDLVIVSAHTNAAVKGLLRTTGVALLELQLVHVPGRC